MSATSSPRSLVFALLFVLLHASSAHGASLSSNFYAESCPSLKSIVRNEMAKAIKNERRIGASILRLFFHDCFILGCDASLLLDGSGSEKTAGPNVNSARGFDVIDTIKASVEEACNGTVSCADILALASLEGVKQLGGPSWKLGLGRRDSLTASQTDANSGQLPPGSSDLDNLITRFSDKGLSATDMTALSGAHTIGQARCTTFRAHLSESNIDPDFAAELQQNCPASGGDDDSLAPLDDTATTFDNDYYKNLLEYRGLLHSDQELFNGGSQDSLVTKYASDKSAFFKDFATAMTKMSNINPLTGNDGEIRKNCRATNN